MLRAASIYDEPKDGMTVLVTRYWPRGFRKGSFDMWMRDLAPSATLLKNYKNGLPWAEFDKAYRAEMSGQPGTRALDELRQLSDRTDVTILCYEPDGQPCHRNIILELAGSSNTQIPG